MVKIGLYFANLELVVTNDLIIIRKLVQSRAKNRCDFPKTSIIEINPANPC
jgi:hypothetical protein